MLYNIVALSFRSAVNVVTWVFSLFLQRQRTNNSTADQRCESTHTRTAEMSYQLKIKWEITAD